MFTDKDLAQLKSHGIDADTIHHQLESFRQGFPFLNIDRAAVVGDGIRRLNPQEQQTFRELFNAHRNLLQIVKFVPASGAATRMFKEMFAFLADGKPTPSVQEVVDNINRFAFGARLKQAAGDTTDAHRLIDTMLSPKGLGYGSAPKALVLFHRYADGNRTALEEHLCEGALYAAGHNGEVNIHFTVSPEHQAAFEALVQEVLPRYEQRYGVHYQISYSCQRPSTDTLAVGLDNEPFREDDGRLLLRPAGHGALLENLGEIEADLIFIKNIDNVTTDARKADTVRYKEILAGQLLALQAQCFDYLKQLEESPVDAMTLQTIEHFLEQDLCLKLPDRLATLDAEGKRQWLIDRLHRPIRVCGMVRNDGEPGGGPYWVKEADGSQSLQIAESTQIAPEQKGLMAAATHFNPVDLVCATRDRHGNRFDLSRYVDPQTGFISEKSKNGRPLRALERPGLWNGSMAHWNTVFVEVPSTVFSPVKTVNDLLRPEHQPQA